MKHLLFFIIVMLNATLICSQTNSKSKFIVKQRNMLKDYAFCKCISYGFSEDSLSKKDYSTTVLVEQLDYNPKVLFVIDSLITKFVDSLSKSKYYDVKGKRGIMINCIDKYRSENLDLYIKKLDKYLIAK